MAVTHRSIGVAVETLFGSLDTNTNLPSESGLTYISIPCERDPVVLNGEVPISERLDTRDGSYFIPPEIDTVLSGGNNVQRRTGTVTIRLDLTTIGSSAADYSSNYLGYLLGAFFKTKVSSVTSATVSTITSTNAFQVVSGGPTATDVGTLISSELKGRVEYSAITDDADGSSDITISPAFSANFTGTPDIRGTQTWFPGSRTNTGEREHSLSFRIDGVNFQEFYFGCVGESLNISLDNGRLMAEMTFQAAHIKNENGSATGPIEPVYNNGAPPFFRNSYVIVSDSSPTSLTNASTGDKLGQIQLDCEDFTLSYTNTLTPLGHSESIIAMSDMEITDIDIELTLTLSTVNTTLNNDYIRRVVRQVLVGTGPTGDGLGCAIMIPAAQLANDPAKYDVSGNDIVRQTLTYKQSRFGGDVIETGAGNSPFRLALGI